MQYPEYGVDNRSNPQHRYVPKTAINEMDSFMSGLTDLDRQCIFETPDFAGQYSALLQRFLFWLLQGDVGRTYIESDPQRREAAEFLKLRAQEIYSGLRKQEAVSTDALMKECELLRSRVQELETLKKTPQKGNSDAGNK